MRTERDKTVGISMTVSFVLRTQLLEIEALIVLLEEFIIVTGYESGVVTE